MDPQIEELKQLVRQNIALAQETNKMLKHMRSAARFKSVIWWLLVLASIGLSVWSYYAFVAPRIEQIQNVYVNNIAPLQGASGTIMDFIKHFGQGSTTSAN